MFIRIYALAVCFASMMCIAISSGIGLFDVVQASMPGYTVSAHQYGAGVYAASARMMIRDDGALVQPPRLTEEELKAQQAEYRKLAIEQERHGAIRSLLQILTILVVSIPLFFVHWRLAKRLEGGAANDSAAP
ncbi:MAG: hypothetical protein O2780_09320 [Proteobacteria bacterium]|jgi:hypothetical protein|nr:hypothetical protein [Pseudomonadota bacterium]MDA1301268.1 hypothetical protein [Pseudomonadota bacterium]